jgi:succinoglycan biosynthesis protein ExoA
VVKRIVGQSGSVRLTGHRAAVPAASAVVEELVTVVVPARNEERHIGPCLRSIRDQDYRHLQVIVVDGASSDATREIVRRHIAEDPRIELMVNNERIIPTSLNLALGAAHGAWLVRVDAHATVPPDYVRRAVTHLRSGKWGGVGGIKVGRGVTPAGRAIAAAMASRFGVGGSSYHYGTKSQPVEHVPFGAYPVDLARSLGGWNEQLTVNQDFELDYRIGQAGKQLLFDPALRIDWQCRQSVPDLFRQYRRYGRGKVAVVRLHPRSMRPRHAVPPALVLSWLLGAAVAVHRPGPGFAIVAPYAAALTAATVTTARRLERPAERKWVAPAFVAMHAGWGLGFCEGVLATIASRPARGARRGEVSESALLARDGAHVTVEGIRR